MGSPPRYLLIIGCSQRKRPDPGLLPAIERYDGVNFRVLRKARREGYWPENLDVLIVSAKYGLISADTLIENYDLKMTQARAFALQAEVSADLDSRLQKELYREVFVNLGKLYMITLALSRGLTTIGERVSDATGGIGEKMSQMKKWIQDISTGEEAQR